jgi:hypothetical protein
MNDKSVNLNNRNASLLSFDELSENLIGDLNKGLSDDDAKSRLHIGIYALILMLSVSVGYYYAYVRWEEPDELNNNNAFFSLTLCHPCLR